MLEKRNGRTFGHNKGPVFQCLVVPTRLRSAGGRILLTLPSGWAKVRNRDLETKAGELKELPR